MTERELEKTVAQEIAYHLGYTWASSGLDHDSLYEAARAAIEAIRARQKCKPAKS